MRNKCLVWWRRCDLRLSYHNSRLAVLWLSVPERGPTRDILLTEATPRREQLIVAVLTRGGCQMSLQWSPLDLKIRSTLSNRRLSVRWHREESQTLLSLHRLERKPQTLFFFLCEALRLVDHQADRKFLIAQTLCWPIWTYLNVSLHLRGEISVGSCVCTRGSCRHCWLLQMSRQKLSNG